MKVERNRDSLLNSDHGVLVTSGKALWSLEMSKVLIYLLSDGLNQESWGSSACCIDTDAVNISIPLNTEGGQTYE
jgi:hypothetical protein